MKSRIALMLLSLCLVVPLHADEERVITLSESLDMAEKTSISLEMERIILSDDLSSSRTDFLSERINLLTLETEHLLYLYELASVLGMDISSLQSEYAAEIGE